MTKAELYIKATTAHGGDTEFPDVCSSAEYEREFEQWLDGQQKASDVVLYRGYCFDLGYWTDCDIKVGDTIGVDQLTQDTRLPAFTSDKMRASIYMNEFGDGVGSDDCIKVLFEIRTCGKHFVDISEQSSYKEEKEFRCGRGMKMVVERIERKCGFYQLCCNEV